jgi:hypothetical protein
MRHDNDNEHHERRRRERAATIFGAIWAAGLALIVGWHLLPTAPAVLAGVGW